MKYHLEVLNDKEFEDLCKELFDIYYNVDFQIFRAGKDSGIDLLYSGNRENQIVVQCKHYVNSNYKLLYNALLNTELVNVKKMQPSPLRYVVATSLSLSTGQTKEVKSVLNPFIRNTNDVFGRKRIENLLLKNPDVEKRFFKLWLTSTNVLLKIIHNASHYNSEFHKEKILNSTKLYVTTQDFNQAINKLAQNKFVIISGAPGVGKTTLAYMLICERLAEGYELVYCDGKISEVEHAFSDDPLCKQIFFIDDFLGANLYDIANPKNPENKLISFIQKFQVSKNKYIVLTSRTTVLNQAVHNYEHLKFSGLTTISKYELLIRQYSLLDKAKILYNHLYFGNIDESFLKPFFEKKTYSLIITHRNYFPRLIQFITDEKRFIDSNYISVEEFIKDKLENPEIIWEYAFEKQLDDEDRYLLLCLFSLGGTGITEDCLSKAFEKRYKYEIANNNIRRKTTAFKNSLRKLLDGFINSFRDTRTNTNTYSFINPSITDFLLQYLRGNIVEISSILLSTVYIEQLTIHFGLNTDKKITIEKPVLNDLFNFLMTHLYEIQTIRVGSSAPLRILEVVQSYFNEELNSRQNVPINLITDILSSSEIDSYDFSYTILLIGLDKTWTDVISYISQNFLQIADLILAHAKSEDDLSHFVEIFEMYGYDFSTFINVDENRWFIQEKLSSIFTDIIGDMTHDDQSIAEHVYEFGPSSAEERLREKIWNDYVEFTDRLSLGDYFDDFDHEYELDAAEIVENIRHNYSFEDEDYSSRIVESENEKPQNEWTEIDRLFTI